MGVSRKFLERGEKREREDAGESKLLREKRDLRNERVSGGRLGSKKER